MGVGWLVLLMVALYGHFAIVEAIARFQARRKLRQVNRRDAARLLAKVCSIPAGVRTHELLESGFSPQALREATALLLLDGWIELHPCDHTIAQRSSIHRKLSHRHPLADVFDSVAP